MCLCISVNNAAGKKKSIMWERKGIYLQEHCLLESEGLGLVRSTAVCPL